MIFLVFYDLVHMKTLRVAAHLQRVHSTEEVVVEHRVQYCRHHRTWWITQPLADRTARQRRRSLERGFDPIETHCKSVQLPEDTHFCVVSTQPLYAPYYTGNAGTHGHNGFSTTYTGRRADGRGDANGHTRWCHTSPWPQAHRFPEHCWHAHPPNKHRPRVLALARRTGAEL